MSRRVGSTYVDKVNQLKATKQETVFRLQEMTVFGGIDSNQIELKQSNRKLSLILAIEYIYIICIYNPPADTTLIRSLQHILFAILTIYNPKFIV